MGIAENGKKGWMQGRAVGGYQAGLLHGGQSASAGSFSEKTGRESQPVLRMLQHFIHPASLPNSSK